MCQPRLDLIKALLKPWPLSLGFFGDHPLNALDLVGVAGSQILE